MKKILIVGVTSTIAQETAKFFASNGDSFFVTGRNEQKLKAVVGDLKVRGANEVFYAMLDVNNFKEHQIVFEKAVDSLGRIDTVLIAHGTLPNQKACEKDATLTLRELETNFISIISLLTLIANYMEKQKNGCIAVISSVAGDRGRQSNYIYGSAKAGVSAFLQGLRNRLSKSNVRVVTIKPGLVDTSMTAHLKKSFLFTDAQTIGKGIYQAIINKKDVVYLPWFWRWIMLIIKLIPEYIFKKMNL